MDVAAITQMSGLDQHGEPPVRICVPNGFFERLMEACDFRTITRNAFSRYNPRPSTSKADPAIFFKILLLEYIFDISSDALRNEFSSHPGLRAFLQMDEKPIIPQPNEIIQFRVKLGWMGFKRILDAVIREAQRNKMSDVDCSILEKRYGKPLMVTLTDSPVATPLPEPSNDAVPAHKISSYDRFETEVPSRPKATRSFTTTPARETRRTFGDDSFPAEVPTPPRIGSPRLASDPHRLSSLHGSEELFAPDIPSRPQMRPSQAQPAENIDKPIQASVVAKTVTASKIPQPIAPPPSNAGRMTPSVSAAPRMPAVGRIDGSVYLESTLHETAQMIWGNEPRKETFGPRPSPQGEGRLVSSGIRPVVNASSLPEPSPVGSSGAKLSSAPEDDPLGIDVLFEGLDRSSASQPLPRKIGRPVEKAESPQPQAKLGAAASKPSFEKQPPRSVPPPVYTAIPAQAPLAQSFTLSSPATSVTYPAPPSQELAEETSRWEYRPAEPASEETTPPDLEPETAVAEEMAKEDVPVDRSPLEQPFRPTLVKEEAGEPSREDIQPDSDEDRETNARPPQHWVNREEWQVPSASIKLRAINKPDYDQAPAPKRFSALQFFTKSLYVAVPLLVLFGIFVIIMALKDSGNSIRTAEPKAAQTGAIQGSSAAEKAPPNISVPASPPVIKLAETAIQTAVPQPKAISAKPNAQPKSEVKPARPVTPSAQPMQTAQAPVQSRLSSVDAAKKQAILLHLRNYYHLDLQADQYTYDELKDILNRLEKETKVPNN